ncbi:MAG TPA: R3H domain-containing nucleic acid-binding protein, partial [Candidatus Dormibacteraeota bacterium]|nr:R3H domain-containing nucleic acid-binding protein [Candidatus Dormibacteraeota bacterium]
EEARRRGTQKSVLERKAPPTFDALVEIVDRRQVAVHLPLADVVDDVLRGRARRAQLREVTSEGGVSTRWAEPPQEPDRWARELLDEPAQDLLAARGPGARGIPPGGPRPRRAPSLTDVGDGRSAAPSGAAIFPYGVSRTYLEQAVRDLQVPVRIQHHVDDADMVLTLKSYYRRKDSPLRAAEAEGIPISILRSNTVAQIRALLVRLFHLEEDAIATEALREAREGIERAQRGLMVELTPQNAYVRRLQHQLVEQHSLVARSTGKDPRRRLRIYGPTPNP